MIEPTPADIGRHVLYQRGTARDVERGVITKITDDYVFVRYGQDTHSKATLRTGLDWATAFADCALPDSCECLKRGYPQHDHTKCLVPTICRTADAWGWRRPYPSPSMPEIITHMETQAQDHRRLSVAARRCGDTTRANMFEDRAVGFEMAAELLRKATAGE